MTELQMRHSELVEDARHNTASEEETHRANTAREALTALSQLEEQRANKAREEETHRANVEREADARKQTSLKESAEQRAAERHPLEMEDLKAAIVDKGAAAALKEIQGRDIRWNKLNDTKATSADATEALLQGDVAGAAMNTVADAASYIGKLISGLTGLDKIGSLIGGN